MTEQEIREAYPGAAEAVLLHETSMDLREWKVIRKLGLSPSTIVAKLKVAAEKAVKLVPEGPLKEVLPQMSHSDFLRYIAAKMGMV